MDSFVEIRNFLLQGGEIAINADSEQCTVTPALEGPLLINMPLRHWQIVDSDEAGLSIRADDFFVSTPPGDQIAFILRRLTIRPDNMVEVALSSTLNGTEPLTMDCQLGVGANGFAIVNGDDLSHIDNYNEIKGTLLLGSHVEAIVNFNLCENSQEVLPPGVRYTAGFQINRFTIRNEGTPEEIMGIQDDAVIAIQDGSEGISAERMILTPDGTALIDVGILSTEDLSQIRNISLTCQVGIAVDVTYHNRERDGTYDNYNEIRRATLAGHDMEVVVFLEGCDVIEGEPIQATGVIASARFDGFQLFPQDSIVGNELEYIAYSSWGLNPEGNLEIDVLRVLEDNTAQIELFRVPAGSTQETDLHILSCPLGNTVLFHAVRRDRNPIDSFRRLVEAVVEDGQVFEIEINYAECNTGEVQLDSIAGGILWETYIDPDRESGFFFADVSAVVQQSVTGTAAPGWDAADIVIFPDNTVQITPKLYDWFTGASLFPDQPPIICELNDNLNRGGARLFRYP